MAKSGKHKKLRRQEKAKVQLKGTKTKTLGKSSNVIEPKLQTKKIFLREQLGNHSDERVLTKQKRNIQDIFTALNHHNTNTRIDALSGLHELITSENDIVQFHLGKIIEKVSQLTSDIESSVRKENLRVAEVLLSQVSEDQLKPFWNLLLTHLKCTMTHLNPFVRRSCLSFVTMLTARCPKLVAYSSSIILPSVLNLISCVTNNTSPSSAQANSSRLKVDIEDKITHINERIRVLSLISSCLSLNLDVNLNGNGKNREISPSFSSDTKSVYTEIFYPFGYSGENNRNSVSSGSDKEAVAEESIADSAGLNVSSFDVPPAVSFINCCLPILFETWIEVAPVLKGGTPSKKIEPKKKKSQVGFEDRLDESSGHLNKTAVEVLECVVEVIVNLFKLKTHNRVSQARCPGPGRRQNEGIHFLQNEMRIEKFDCQVIHDDVTNETLIRELRKTFGHDLQKYFFNFLPFSCVHDGQRQCIVTVNLQLFHVAASLRAMDHHLTDEFEKYIQGVMKKRVLLPDQVALVLETAKLIRATTHRMVYSEFIIFAIQTGNQKLVYKFLENILSLTSTPDDAKFADTVDWQYLYPHMIQDLTSESKWGLISVLTLIAIRKHLSIDLILKDNLEKFKSLLMNSPNDHNSASIFRLFYYANLTHLLSEQLHMN